MRHVSGGDDHRPKQIRLAWPAAVSSVRPILSCTEDEHAGPVVIDLKPSGAMVIICTACVTMLVAGR